MTRDPFTSGLIASLFMAFAFLTLFRAITEPVVAQSLFALCGSVGFIYMSVYSWRVGK